MLGYAPPEEAEIGVDLCLSWAVDHGVVIVDDPQSALQSNPSTNNAKHYDNQDEQPIKVTATQPEMQVVVKATGEVSSHSPTPSDIRPTHIPADIYTLSHTFQVIL